ncbi:MAG: CHAD domain-containing protein [Sporichthyaceae bacterium]
MSAPAPAADPPPRTWPDEFELPDPAGPDDPTATAIGWIVSSRTRKVHRAEHRMRTGDGDGVRKMRIATRRLRSDLRTLRPLLDEDWARALSRDLGDLADALGGVRDREVLAARLDHDLARIAPGAHVGATRAYLHGLLGGPDAAPPAAGLTTLDTTGYTDLRARLADARAAPRLLTQTAKPCAEVLPPLVERTCRRLAKAVRRLPMDPPSGALDPATDGAWHAARIDAKRARYAADAVIPVFGAPAADLASILTEVTRCLGEHQDASVAAEGALALAAEPEIPAAVALGLGLLYGVERHAVVTARARFRTLWPQVGPTVEAFAQCGRDLRQPTRKPATRTDVNS